MTDQHIPSILIVEDEPDVAETYRIWLDADYDVTVVDDGDDALAAVDEDVDVVLLDRMLPGTSGGGILEEIRSRGIDCRVAMVTAVDPDFDVVEMGFDEYVSKPPDREELVETIELLLERASADDALQEYYSLVARRSALEAEKTPAELEGSDAYAELEARIDEQREAADVSLGDMGSDIEFVGAVRELGDGPADGTEDDR